MKNNIICALATPHGRGAVAMVRASGKGAVEAVANLLDEPKREEILKAGGYSLHYAEIRSRGETLDQVLIAVFRAPASYTGEDSVEISCHCSNYIITELLDLLYGEGVRLAGPGEFTKRAFLNGKMDLAQAESVADLIESETEAAHRLAMNQMKGGFSRELAEMRNQMLKIVSLMELELDFSEEEVEFADRDELDALLDKVMHRIGELVSGFRLGNAIKNGIPVAIVGATNTGKSTLLNLLLGEDRAIVSPISGTTRDSIEDTVNIGGTLFRFIDTAGIRTATETIEMIGIERTYSKIKQAETVILMLDAEHPESFGMSISSLRDKLSDGQKTVIVLNKCDLLEENGKGPDLPTLLTSIRDIASRAGMPPAAVLHISALKGEGLDLLRKTLTELRPHAETSPDVTLVTNMRHYEALRSACDALARVKEGLAAKLSTDLLTQDLREALYYIGTIVGEISNEEVLDEIFGKFCIGK
ncbi:MAG: tRNA uridine-5-carboxymethylaminomethyl(34) synthesis GTPase MnmE [Bacteroidales bacterium]|nr:tRNA uridine-5-carboxymethylaminomethyl(34) synthesis GTPase MnmE [Bacteroidales bacterium]